MTSTVYRRLVGGVVGFEEGSRIAEAVRSLTGQAMPPGADWEAIWVVVSPDGAATVSHARRAAESDPRVQVVVETGRRGKSAALAEVFRRASGDLLILLNGDARARPGAVLALVGAAQSAPSGPFGIMGRPVVPTDERGPLASALRLLWALHDRFHEHLLAGGGGNHLSDELLALPLDALPELPVGVVNDGAYLARTLRRRRGSLLYARDAEVEITLPGSFRALVAQRARILSGHRQLSREPGEPPLGFAGLALREPSWGSRTLLRALSREPVGAPTLLLAEAAARLRALAETLRGGAPEATWARVTGPPREDAGADPARPDEVGLAGPGG